MAARSRRPRSLRYNFQRFVMLCSVLKVLGFAQTGSGQAERNGVSDAQSLSVSILRVALLLVRSSPVGARTHARTHAPVVGLGLLPSRSAPLCSTLLCFVRCHDVPCRAVLCYAVLCCTVLHCTALRCAVAGRGMRTTSDAASSLARRQVAGTTATPAEPVHIPIRTEYL
jgi:hypothetical protein